MSKSEVFEYLKRYTDMTDKEIKRSLDTLIFYPDTAEGYEEFKQNLIGCLRDPEEVPESWERLEKIGDYRFDFCL